MTMLEGLCLYSLVLQTIIGCIFHVSHFLILNLMVQPHSEISTICKFQSGPFSSSVHTPVPSDLIMSVNHKFQFMAMPEEEQEARNEGNFFIFLILAFSLYPKVEREKHLIKFFVVMVLFFISELMQEIDLDTFLKGPRGVANKCPIIPACFVTTGHRTGPPP